MSIRYSNGLTRAQADEIYLRLDTSNDPLTGELVINPASGNDALDVQKNVKFKEGTKIYFDDS